MAQTQKKKNASKAKNMAAKKIQAAFRGSKARGGFKLGAGSRNGLKATPDHVRQHILATHCPFNPAAKGARTPSQYGIATNVHTSTVSYTLTSTAAGFIDAVVLPHPIWSVLGGYSSITGGVAATMGVGGAATQPCRGNVSTANLSAAYTNYRVVAWGVRLKSLQSYTGASGRIYLANIPTMPQLPVLAASQAGVVADVWDSLGVPFDGTGVSDQLLNYPRSAHMNGAELVSEGGVEIRPHFTGPGHEHFRESHNLGEQGLVSRGPLGTVTANLSLGFADVSGNSMIVIRGDGLTASTATHLLEVIYHLEGTPIVSTTAGAIVPAAPTPPPTPNAAQHMAAAVSSLSSSPFVSYISEVVKNEAVGAARRNLPPQMAGLAEKVIGLGFKELPSVLEYGASMLPLLL